MSTAAALTPPASVPLQYLVAFERIGRAHNPRALVVQTDDLDDLADRIHDYADGLLASQDVDILVEEGEETSSEGKVIIFVGGVRVAGRGVYRRVYTLLRDENCAACDYPETNSVIPADDEGNPVPMLLATYCRSCGHLTHTETEAAAS